MSVLEYSRDTIRRCLQESEAFRALDPEWFERFVEAATMGRLHEDDRLWSEGDAPTELTYIHRGLVKVKHTIPNGAEVSTGMFGPGSCVGALAALNHIPYPASAVVVSRVAEVVHIPLGVVTEASERAKGFTGTLHRHFLDVARQMHARIDVLSGGTVPARLALLLLHLVERFGATDGKGGASLSLSLSRNAIAELVAARPETVIRTFAKWRQEGWLQEDDHGITLRDLEVAKTISREG
jgi:CRP-like cAMP-binding protein